MAMDICITAAGVTITAGFAATDITTAIIAAITSRFTEFAVVNPLPGRERITWRTGRARGRDRSSQLRPISTAIRIKSE